MFMGLGSQDKASWAGPWKLQLLQLAKNCWEMLYSSDIQGSGRNMHEIWNLFTTNILWVMPLCVQGSGIRDILRSCHCGVHTIETAPLHYCVSMAGMSPGRIGCAIQVRQGFVTSMTVHSAPPPVCQVTAKQRWQLSPPAWGKKSCDMSAWDKPASATVRGYQIIKTVACSWWCQCFVSERN